VAGMSLSTGLISGMDTGTIISQLMQVEANPQTLLKQQLSSTQSKGTAYRAINTRFEGLRNAAEALAKPDAWTATKASSSPAGTVTATASPGASTGSVTFAVTKTATSHSVISDQIWNVTSAQTAADVSYGATTIAVGSATPVTIGGTGTLADAVKAINARTDLKLSATAVRVSPTEYRLQVTSKDTGTASTFSFGDAGTFDPVTVGQNAELKVGGAGGYTMSSATNTFSGLIDGTTFTVSGEAPSVTLTVASDPQAVSNKVAALVSAANGLLDAISSYTSAESSSASLKGDSTLRELSGQMLDIVSRTLGGGGSASVAGLELSKGGRFEFTAETFVARLTAEPALTKNLFAATTSTAGVDTIPGNTDDVVTPVGIAARFAALAKTASDETTGTLTLLAKSKDTAATDLEKRIDSWDIRLELRRTTLSRQFTAMEKALSTLQNQSSWLSSQISSLPSWSSSKS
jgi:flagellar hook-associated protein 2